MLDLQEILNSIEWKFATGFLSGLAIGVFSRLALKVLIAGAFFVMAFEIVHSMGIL